MNFYNEGWSSLKHGGLLISANKLTEYFPETLPSLNHWQVEQLRRAVTAFDGSNASLGALLDYMLQDLSGFPADQWQKAQSVESQWSIRSFTGALVKPRRIWCGPNGEVLPVFVPEEGATRQFGGRLGVGRSRKLLSRVTEWLRRQHLPFAMVTNGRQWRLVHAGSDFESWCEWDIEFWFEEGEPSAQTLAWRTLINPQNFLRDGGRSARLHKAVNESRKGQAELSAVLGERVRQSVENLISASQATIETANLDEKGVEYNHLYVAGSRIIMRCIVTLFAEARQLLPVDNTIYQQAYSLEGLRQQLDRRSGGRGSDRLTHGRSAWPRLIALFNLIYHGSAHQAIPVPHYGGALFEPGDPESSDPISRALAVLESQDNLVSDQQVLTILRLLTRTRVKIRQGNRNTWVDGPVNFSALSSEYIGILYEGLLDFELKRAKTDDPVIFLGIGNQPALALSQLEQMDDKTIKKLFEELKRKSSSAGDDEGEEEPETEVEDEAETEDESEDLAEEAEQTPDEEEEPALTEDHLERAQEWLEKAAILAGVVKKPRGRAGRQGEVSDELKKAAKQLCAKMIAPGQFYLVRWGGTRKGAGTFYTRPQLAAPTVRRTLQPLAYEGISSAIDSRTGLEEVTQWAPKPPEDILSLKVCDPAMGSGSFLVGALRYLTDALVESLFHHEYVKPAGEDEEATLDEERISALLSDELLKLKPGHEGFEETLRAQLKRHVVERCLYGVDIDPLAVELGRMALWVETMDRDLPFGFLDHKLKAGNALVGAWFDTYREYPAMAWQREGGDKDYQKGKPDNLINHFYVKNHTGGKKKGQQETKGDVFTDAIKERSKAVPEQLIAIISGQVDMDERLPAADVHDELLKVFRKLHRLPVHESDKRAELYREQILKNPHYHELKARMDLWCALWFWPGESIDSAPLPQDFLAPSAEALSIGQQVAQINRFFHWELEYPDVFTYKTSGFDAVLGNPPWETMQPYSKEFFSNYDPLYRAYGKQEALTKQQEYFLSNPELEHAWIKYIAGFKAYANWMNNVGAPFGNRVVEVAGKKRHEINLGGRGKNSFRTSESLHLSWSKQRRKTKGFADENHPFLHQGSGKPYLQKMFMELAYSLLNDTGRIGMIVPSGLYSDKGTTELRELFLNNCDWQWIFSFENREKIFDIHRSFKFSPVIIEKGKETRSIRASFMHRNVDDWESGEDYIFPYPKSRVLELSPYSKSILEIRSKKDLDVLTLIYSNSDLLGDSRDDGWGIVFNQGDFNMTSDSKLFPERQKWESKGYHPDEYGFWIKGNWKDLSGYKDILSRDGDIVYSRDGKHAVYVDEIQDAALPVYSAKIFDLWDFCVAGWLSGKGRGAKWEAIDFPKVISPEYLMARSVYLSQCKVRGLGKLLFKDISTAIHKRTMMSAIVPDFPAVNASPILTCRDRRDDLVLQTVTGSFVFDYVAKFKIGYLHLNYFILEECPVVNYEKVSQVAGFLREISLRLSAVSEVFSPLWESYCQDRSVSWRKQWAVTGHERLRLRVILDALMAYLGGLDSGSLSWILSDCDHPKALVCQKEFSSQLDQKRFWRIDKNVDPEIRHTVLTLVAFEDLVEKGVEEFLSQNGGEGWLIPETLCLSDYGLGHDDRAQEHQPVASRLGPRFYDWQLKEDVTRSWEECAAHAELIRQIVPEPESADEVAEEPAEYKVESTQGALF